MAMARLSSTTGEPVRRVSSPYSARDLRPVARHLGVQRSDGGLQDIGAAAAQGERAVELGAYSGDLLGVPT